MNEQQACTLCGAGGHTAAQCNWNDRRLTFTLESLTEALGNVMCLHELGVELIAANLFRQHPEQAEGAQGHGHVIPREDGVKARCGGPAMCKVCQAEQARAALAQPSPAPELWAVHAQGPDDLYAAFSRDDAEKYAAELNALPMPEGITVGAVVVPSPWPAIEHWKYLAEQEREHNASLVAQAGQVPDSAASAKALVEIEAKKYSLNAAGMFNSGAPDHRQTIAVQELLADFDDDEAEGHWEAIMAYSDLRASDALFHAAEMLAAAPAQGGE